jgi:hypothetical protein
MIPTSTPSDAHPGGVTLSVQGEVRTYRLNTEPSAALFREVEEHREELLKREGETDDRYGMRLYYWFTETPDRFSAWMRTALRGDHGGVDWYYDGNIVECIRALNDYLSAVLPKMSKILDGIPKA